MTINGGKPHRTGDEGQRYEIRARDRNGKEFIVGWVETMESVKRFLDGVGLNPAWHSGRYIDRKPEGYRNGVK